MQLDFQGPVDINFRKFEKAWLDIPVFNIFSDVVGRNPAQIAIKCGSKQLTYQETYNWVINIANTIRASHSLGEPIGIALPNDVFFPVAMMAALAAGCPYVPLDIDLPIARNQLIIEQSGIRSVITNSDLPVFSDELTLINIENLAGCENKASGFNPSSEDIAYIIYTSGSTGSPKGVYQNQRNLLHDVMQYTNSVHLNENDRLTLLYSPSVNGAIRDIYGALLNGATLVIKNLKATGLYNIAEFIRQEKITIYHSIPNIFRTFLKLSTDKIDFVSVRLIYLAGDRIYNTDVDLYKLFFPSDSFLYVGIGATEIATIYRQWFINHTTIINQELIPLGHAVEDREMVLLNEENRQVSDGETGEIIVRSQYISIGYWKSLKQTAESFSINSEITDLRTYRTGDLGRINHDGLLEFIGRKDNQVKVNGYRVELGEIEAILMNYPSVKRCGVVLHTSDKHNSLFAFYTSEKGIPEIKLKNWMAERLPDYMIPQRCIQLSDIPLLHNFKNDNKSLKVLAEKYAGLPFENLEPSNKKEDFLLTTLRRTWCKFLDEKSFEENMRWKDAGGDSLNAVNFLVQLESDLGTALTTDWIHGAMTPHEIYDYLKTLNIQEKINQNQIIYVFPSILGITENTRVFLKNLSDYATVRIINYPRISDTIPENRNLDYVTSFIINQIPTYNSPDVGFLGVCSGAIIMNHIISNIPLNHCSFLGIVEGNEKYKIKPLNENFLERSFNFIRRGNVLNNSINYLYNYSTFSKKIIHWFEKVLRKDYRSVILWSWHLNLTPTYIDNIVFYFGCDNSMLDRNGEHWKPYFKKLKPVALKGKHIDMLNTDNAAVVLTTVDHILKSKEVCL